MKKHRIQFDLTDKALRQVDAIKKKAGLTTRAELFRRAIALYRLAVSADKVIIEKNGEQETVVI